MKTKQSHFELLQRWVGRGEQSIALNVKPIIDLRVTKIVLQETNFYIQNLELKGTVTRDNPLSTCFYYTWK